MALLGHPGKFTYCIAENEESSPFEPLHVALGFDADSSVATLVGAEAPQSVFSIVDADDPDSASRLLLSIATCLANPGSNNFALRGGAATVILNPDHAAVLAASGYDRSRICAELYELTSTSQSELRKYLPTPLRSTEDEVVRCFKSVEDILVFVAGGGGLYTMVMPSWCAGPHRNTYVSKEIRLGEWCEVPTG